VRGCWRKLYKGRRVAISIFGIMKRKAMFCCDSTSDIYEYYYTNQSGRGMPVFAGARYQLGHGLGSILGGLFRRVVAPFFRANGRTLASKAIKTGLEVADDVVQGKSFTESAKRRIPKGIKEAVVNIDWQTGSGTSKSKHRTRRGGGRGRGRNRVVLPRKRAGRGRGHRYRDICAW